MIIKVEVTAEDIKKGERGNKPWTCPVARAVNRAVQHLGLYSSVNHQYIRLSTKKSDVDLGFPIVPSEAKEWIERYDAGKKVEPITFILDTKNRFPYK